MIKKVDSFIRELFPSIINLKIVEIDKKFECEYSYYVSDLYGNPILRINKINVGIVDGFLKIVE
jgi:hypothetical protein